ncbi:MAG: hypothetical protein K1000chlam2_01256 [Chlamydiae bacterium]|nr:hypothetical protein [Chlamydiota bacterium]
MTNAINSQISSLPTVNSSRSEFKNPLAKKVGRVAITALLYTTRVVFAPLTIAAISYRLYSKYSMKSTIEELGKKRYKALLNAIGDSTSNSSADMLALLTSRPKSGYHAYMQKVRSTIDAALATSEGENDPVLLLAAHTLTTQAPGMESIEAYGKKVTDRIPIPEKELSYSGLADVLDEAVKRHTYFNKDNVISHIFWIFAHPEKALHAFFDQTGLQDPLKYNSFARGNANIHIGSFDVGNAKIHFSLGPTPTCDRLFEAHLKYLKDKQGHVHFFHDLEGGPSAENTRVREKGQLAVRFPEQLTYKSTPFDKFDLNEITKQAFETIKEIAKDKTDIYLGQACKQDIDRGVILNVITMLRFDKLANKPLTRERLNQIVGIVLLRAGMVDDRAILANRYAVLSNYLRAM